MADIGSTLREARMRARIDITEVEESTKIRAKYLRALENEEWNLLPGSTFIKSFLREYADYLGLDSRALVEDYKLRYERPSEQELMPISPSLGRDRRGGGGGRGVPPRWTVAGVLVLVLVVALGLLGALGDDEPKRQAQRPVSTPQDTTPRTTTTPRRAPAAPTRASLRLVPTGEIYVCLVDQRGRVLIPGTTYSAGDQVPVQRARSMRLTLGNNQVQLRVNGRSVAVPASATAIAYELTPEGARTLPEDQAPTCTA
jgi:hypothetical protein